MRNRAAILLLALVLCYGIGTAVSYQHHREHEHGDESGGEDLFLLQHSKRVVQTDAGEMRVVMGHGFGGKITERPMHIGFITMEPKTLFIPQYLDSHLIIFIQKGEARIGLIYKDELVERRLKIGDIYRVPAGSVFYLVNTGEGQRLQIICSIDPEESLGWGVQKSFSIGGGTYPTSILAGFDTSTLAAAYNVTTSEIKDIMTRQQQGPIVYVSDSHAPSFWRKFLELKEQDRLKQLKSVVKFQEQEDEDENEGEAEEATWSWRKLLGSFTSLFATSDENKKKGELRTGKSPDSYNIYERSPDFSNAYGWSILLDGSDYSPLKHSGVGVYFVNLTAGSMMAPHVNPTATEYGIVLKGSGTVQIVFPNGTSAMKAEVGEGDIFWVPRYFPFCQIASRGGSFEFFGFTTSARKNRPQFLAGRSSIMQTLRSPELAAAFGTSEDKIRRFINDSQRESVILPSRSASTPERTVKEEEEEEEQKEKQRYRRVIRILGTWVMIRNGREER